MFAFEILACIESIIGPVPYRIERKGSREAIVLQYQLTDEQLDSALSSTAHLVGNIDHTGTTTRIEMA